MPGLLRTLRAMAPSRRRQWLSQRLSRLMTKWRGRRLAQRGTGVIVEKPLFWTPEYIDLADHVLIWAGARIEGVDGFAGSGFRPMIRIGERVSIQQNCHITAADLLVIGSDSALLSDAMITDIDHSYETLGVNVNDQPIIIRRTTIGRFCVIGAGSRILAGTTLGNNCIVGANAVVRGTCPSNCVIAGIPGRIVRRFDPATAQWLKTDAEGRFS